MKEKIPFDHKTHARACGIKIRLNSKGDVIVTTPPLFPKLLIPQYLEQARDWIEREKAKMQKVPSLLDDSSVYFFGECHVIEVDAHGDGRVRVKKDGVVIVSPLPHQTTKKTLEKWLKARAIEYILDLLPLWAKKMNAEYRNITFRQQKSRWGSCSSEKNLSFNWRLVHAPPAVIDYVLIHELSHLFFMNHGRQFWDMVAKYDPDYPQHRGWLKRFGGGTD